MIKMNEHRAWRGGRLVRGETYTLPKQAEKMLVEEGVAEYSDKVETASVDTAQRGKPKRKKAVTRGK